MGNESLETSKSKSSVLSNRAVKQNPTFKDQPPDRHLGPTVLIVEDEEMCQKRIELLCNNSNQDQELRLLKANSLKEARETLTRNNPIQVLLLDKVLSWQTGDPD